MSEIKEAMQRLIGAASGDPNLEDDVLLVIGDRYNREAENARLREAVERALNFIRREHYSAEAEALQGHPIDRDARPLWFHLCDALGETQTEETKP